eukprot:TRINITY_DN1083_c0_g1_i1.p1 TRINITY_DN1083_c0_g1~~TRINITY_DN1083_c0_g1_i1.p1  ORF type:complete len:475 (+),score=114.76 TRINITY_DN1083_c0_g1_i1:71-1495(+)
MKCIVLLVLLIAVMGVRSETTYFDGTQSIDFTSRHVNVVPCALSNCKSALSVRGSKTLKIDGKKFRKSKLSYSELVVTAHWSNEMVFECSALPSGAIERLVLVLTGQLNSVKLVGCNVSSFSLVGRPHNINSVTVLDSTLETVDMTLSNFNGMEGFVFQGNTLASMNLVFNVMSAVKWDRNSFQSATFQSNQINADVSFTDNAFDSLLWYSQNLPQLTFARNKYTTVEFTAQNGNKELQFTDNVGMSQVFDFNVVSNNLIVHKNVWCSLVFTCRSASNGIFQMSNNIANEVQFDLQASTPVVFANNTFREGNFNLPLVNSGLTLINNSFSVANFTTRIFNHKLMMIGNTYRDSFSFVLTEVSNGQVSVKNNAGRDTVFFFRQFTGPVEVTNNFFCDFALTVENGNLPQLTVTGNLGSTLKTNFGNQVTQTINQKDVRDNKVGQTDSCQMLPINDAYCPPVSQPRIEVPFGDEVA